MKGEDLYFFKNNEESCVCIHCLMYIYLHAKRQRNGGGGRAKVPQTKMWGQKYTSATLQFSESKSPLCYIIFIYIDYFSLTIHLFIYLFPFYFHRVALSVDKLIYKGALQHNTNNTNFDIQIYIINIKYEVGKITTYNVQKHNTNVKEKKNACTL